MQKYRQKHHTIDLVFAIALFCVFAVSALAVTVSGADLYRRITAQASDEYQCFTALSYLEEKVRQHDYSGGITLEELDGLPALGLHDLYGSEDYTTYVYVQDHHLKELFVKSRSEASPGDGTLLIEAESLTISLPEENLLSLTVTGPDGKPESISLYLQSQGGITE